MTANRQLLSDLRLKTQGISLKVRADLVHNVLLSYLVGNLGVYITFTISLSKLVEKAT